MGKLVSELTINNQKFWVRFAMDGILVLGRKMMRNPTGFHGG